MLANSFKNRTYIKRSSNTLLTLILTTICLSTSICYGTIYVCTGEDGSKSIQEDPCIHLKETTRADITTWNNNTYSKPVSIEQKEEPLSTDTSVNSSSVASFTKSFHASYYDRSKNKLVYSEEVERPAINYFQRQFQNIPAENLSVKWVGTIHAGKATSKSINVIKSSVAKVELWIDGVKQQTSVNRNAYSIDYFFSEGEHTIETHLESSSSTVRFLLTLTDTNKPLNDIELADELASIGDYDVIYCGTFHSSRIDQVIDLDLKPAQKPQVLFLNSVNPVIWDFSRENTQHLKAVVLSAYYFGSQVKNLPPEIPIYHSNTITKAIDFVPRSGKSRGDTFKKAALQIQVITGKKPIGFSGEYSTSNMDVPHLELDEERYNEIGLSLNSRGPLKKQSKEESFETVFETKTSLKDKATPKDQSHPESWANYLPIQKEDIPTNSFRAFYCDNRRPSEVVHSEIVTSPAINVGKDTFHKMAAADVNGYWVGTFTADEHSKKKLAISQYNGEATVFLDNIKVWQGKNSHHLIPLPFNLTQGQHKLEIQFSSQSRSAFFFAHIADENETIDTETLTQELKNIGDFQVMYCGAYKSGNQNNSIPVDLSGLQKPTVIFLSSKRAVRWDFQNNQNENLKAVVVFSRSPRAEIANISDKTTVYRLANFPVATAYTPLHATDFRDTFKNAALQIQAMCGHKPVSYTGEYSLSEVLLPGKVLNEKQYQELGLTMQTTDFDIKRLQHKPLDRIFETHPGSGKLSSSTLDHQKVKHHPVSWGNRLNPSGEVPLNKFKAFYFDVHKPGSSVTSETVNDITFEFGDKYNDIRTQHFAAYWVGKLHYSHPKKIRLRYNQGTAVSRIYLDNEIIYEGSGTVNRVIEMEPGEHLLEVEFVSTWHAVGVFLTLNENRALLAYEDIRESLDSILPKETKTLYAAVHAIDSTSDTVTVNVAEIGSPIFLILSSSDPIKWKIQGPGKNQIKAVLLSSFKNESEVQGELTKEIPTYIYKLPRVAFRLTPKCKCYEAGYLCEGKNFLEMTETLEFLFNRKVSGFTGEYSAKSINVPEVALNPEKYAYLHDELLRVEKEDEECIVTNSYKRPAKKTKPPLSDEKKKELLELPEVQIVFNAYKHIRMNDFQNFKALLSDNVLQTSEESIKEKFTNIHNILARVTEMDIKSAPQKKYWNKRKGTFVRVVFSKKGKFFMEQGVFLEKSEEGFRISRF